MRLHWLWALVAALIVVAPPAAAEGPLHPTPGSCAAAGQVWLLVVNDTGTVLANQCVGLPDSGEQALADGGMSIQYGQGRMICSLAGYPERCPRSFTGSYWTYYHGPVGGPLIYSDVGPASRRPAPGAVEAWCYNAPDVKRCTPPTPSPDGGSLATTSNQPVPLPSSAPTSLLIVGGVVLTGGAGYLVWRRRRPRGTMGGR